MHFREPKKPKAFRKKVEWRIFSNHLACKAHQFQCSLLAIQYPLQNIWIILYVGSYCIIQDPNSACAILCLILRLHKGSSKILEVTVKDPQVQDLILILSSKELIFCFAPFSFSSNRKNTWL